MSGEAVARRDPLEVERGTPERVRSAPVAARRVAIPVAQATRPISVVTSEVVTSQAVKPERKRARPEGPPRVEASARKRAAAHDYRARALALWPRLDAEKLRRTRGDALRIARLVERRTALPLEMIVGMLTRVE